MSRSAIFTTAAELWAEMKGEYDTHLDRAYMLAEEETNGYLLNREGLARGIDPVALFSGPYTRAAKYASEELIDHWQRHPRPSLPKFEKQWLESRWSF